MSANPLDSMPEVRKVLYFVQFIATGILTVAGVVFLATGRDIDRLPEWYVIALAVSPVLWAYLGITAASNVPVATPQR